MVAGLGPGAAGDTCVGVTIVCVVGGSGPDPSGSTTVVVGVVGVVSVGEVGDVGPVVSVGLVVVGVVVVVVAVVDSKVSLGRRTLVRGTQV
ncbi:hypothetical protein MGAD_23500 [Mycolicibacterium gadium]|uniref:Uncharacterized protein n=1 Tax=Mycolicibacterium gadium TaxID=1794 RepID=A0A7I7WMV1_MYCGU|nr:hypothetical protein MGAD_23500 [Mycolicibacterium gadium]